MSEHDINLVTAKAGSVVAENLKLSLATASGSLTPSTITAMVGINQGSALQLAPDVQNVISSVNTKITALRSTGTNDPQVAFSGNISANVGDYMQQILWTNQIIFSAPVKANVGEYITQTTIANRINFSNLIIANAGQYITQTSSGANAVVIAMEPTGNSNVLMISYTTANTFTLTSGNVSINGIDANAYPTTTSANIIQFANAAVLITSATPTTTLFVSYLNANVYTLSMGNIFSRPWTGNINIGGVDANVFPIITSANVTYVANGFVLGNLTSADSGNIRYVTRPNVFILGMGNITIVSGNVSAYSNVSYPVAPSSIVYPGDSDFANLAQRALGNLSSLQSSILPSGNHAAFGAFLNQTQAHIGDSIDLRNTTNFIGNSSFSDFGSGIKNMSSMLDQGLTSKFGSLSSASAALSSGGSMFNGISPKNIGSPVGLVQALNANKLGNASGVNEKLKAAGVDLNNLEDPVYAEKIAQVTGSIKDPAVLNTVADQFGQNPFGGLPSYSGSDASLYNVKIPGIG
jgi:hypothetical protein